MGTTVESIKSSFTNKYYLRADRVITAFEVRNILNQRHVNAGNIFVEGSSLRITPEAVEYLVDHADPVCTRVLAEVIARIDDAAQLPEKVWKSIAERCFIDPLLPVPLMIGLVSKKQRMHTEEVLDKEGLSPGVGYVKKVTEKRGDQLLLRLSKHVKEEYFTQSTHYSWFLGDLLWYGSYTEDRSVRNQLFSKIKTWPNIDFALPLAVLKNLSEVERAQLDGNVQGQWSQVEWDVDVYVDEKEVGVYIINNIPGIYKDAETSLRKILLTDEVFIPLQECIDSMTITEKNIYEHAKCRWGGTLAGLLREITHIVKNIEKYPEVEETFLVLNKELESSIPLEEVLQTAWALFV